MKPPGVAPSSRDVERQPVADEARRVLAGPVEEDVRRVGADQRHLDRRLVRLVREVLEDDLDVGMGLLVLGLGEFDESRIALGLQVPLLDGDRLGGCAPGRPSADERSRQRETPCEPIVRVDLHPFLPW